MKKKASIVILLLGLGLIACPNNAPAPGPTPIPIPSNDAGMDSCEKAEAHLLAMGCIKNPYTAAGKSFAVFCRETMANGIDLHPDCLAKITDCAQINPACVQVAPVSSVGKKL